MDENKRFFSHNAEGIQTISNPNRDTKSDILLMAVTSLISRACFWLQSLEGYLGIVSRPAENRRRSNWQVR